MTNLLVGAVLIALQGYALAYLAYLWLPALAALLASRRSPGRGARPHGGVRGDPERSDRNPAAPGKVRSFAVVVSAHNEDAVIGALLQSLALQEYPADRRRVYVVANNCTDSTASVVRSFPSASCHERAGGDLATKGAALSWLWQRISWEAADCDCVLILDADNLVPPDFLSQINHLFDAGYRVVQSARCAKNAGDSWASQLDSISESLWNRLDQAGRMQLGLTATIAGSGTAFQRGVFEQLVAGGLRGLCEDGEWQARLVLSGIRVGYADRARVYDEKTGRPGQLGRQRKRWVAGVALTARHYGLGMLASGVRSGDIHRLFAGFGATKPPRSLLLASIGFLALLGWLLPGAPALLPWPLWLGALGSFAAYVLLGMALDGARPGAYLALAYAPAFVVLMLAASSMGALRASKQRWVPTSHQRGIAVEQVHER